MVTCTVCKTDKPTSEFSVDKRHSNGLQSRCRSCANAYFKEYAKTPKRASDIAASKMKHAQKIKDGLLPRRKDRLLPRRLVEYNDVRKETCKRYYTSESGKAKRRERDRHKWASVPEYKTEKLLRYRIRMALKGVAKSAKTLDLLGCTVEYAMTHIESRFSDGMSWGNQGAWHIDHIRPFASFDLTDPSQQKMACHYTNLQPLWAADNYKKRDKFDAEHC